MRKLVSIQRVLDIQPIPGADKIVSVTVNGWNMVCKIDEFKIGDLAVYFELDSFLPEPDKRFSFLMARSTRYFDGKPGHRLKSIRLKGVLSQGLLLPLSSFPEIENPEEDLEVTELLNVVKFEMSVPAMLVGKASGFFPSWIRKTDQERCQSLFGKIHAITEGLTFEESVKIDGSSLTAFHYENRPDFNEEKGRLFTGVCSRNMEIKTDNEESVFVKIFNSHSLGLALKTYYDLHKKNMCIQGEVYGEGIQYNLEKVSGINFKVFDVFNIDEQRYLTPHERHSFIKELNELGFTKIESVRIIDREVSLSEFPTMQAFLDEAEGPSHHNTERREGIVFKSNQLDKFGNIFHFKVIATSYLLEIEKD